METHNSGTRLLTVPFAARQKLGISPRKLWGLIRDGHFSVVRIGRRGTRILERDVDDFIERLACKAASRQHPNPARAGVAVADGAARPASPEPTAALAS